MVRKNIVVIRVVTLEDQTLLRMHGDLIEAYYPALSNGFVLYRGATAGSLRSEDQNPGSSKDHCVGKEASGRRRHRDQLL